MNQEQFDINVHLEAKGNKDFMIFSIEDEQISLNMNDDSDQKELKNLFSKILQLVIEGYKPVLKYVENEDYSKGLYIDVCQEYIKDLNREINSVSKKVPEKAAEFFSKV